MRYDNITEGRFISRPNRFIAQVSINGTVRTVHVKNTGRCRELLVPDAKVYLAGPYPPPRRTAYDLVAVEKVTDRGNILTNMDSQAPNKAAEEWLLTGELFGSDAQVRREYTWGDSRFDFFITAGERRIFLEVKGVTLEKQGTAMFPDAPTERGIKHIRELIRALDEGYEAYLLFVIQMKGATGFTPDEATHPEFASALSDAVNAGVRVLAYDCRVTPGSMTIDAPVRVVKEKFLKTT